MKGRPPHRTCMVCGCTDDRACLTAEGPCCWLDPDVDVCSACIGVMIDHLHTTTRAKRMSIVVCACGWRHEGPQHTPRAEKQSIVAHWRDAVRAARPMGVHAWT